MGCPSAEWKSKPTDEISGPLAAVTEIARTAYLVRLGGPDAGQRVGVDETMIVGREDGVDLQLRASDVSRRHARIVRAAGEHMLEDLGSRNGTLVNGEPVQIHVLRFGDMVHFGARSAFIFTHQNPAEEQLLESERVEGVAHLAGGVAHHINNLLSVMLSNLGFLQELPGDTPLCDDTVGESLGDMRVAVGRASSIVRQLVAYARARQGGESAIDVSTLLYDVVGELRQRSAGSRIETEIDPALHFEGDEMQLRQAFENLGDNALEATGEVGRVTVGAHQREIPVEEAVAHGLPTVGPHLEIWVRDSGEGMDPSVRERAFEPFYSTKGPTRGTGLGLAAVYGSIRSHGGFVRVDTAVGAGTTVWIYLPLAGATERPEAAATRRPPRRLVLAALGRSLRTPIEAALEVAGKTLLVVDDTRSLVMRFFERRDEIGLVVVDPALPGLAVEEAVRLLRQSDPTLQIVCCVASSKDREQAAAVKADRVVVVDQAADKKDLASRLS